MDILFLFIPGRLCLLFPFAIVPSLAKFNALLVHRLFIFVFKILSNLVHSGFPRLSLALSLYSVQTDCKLSRCFPSPFAYVPLLIVVGA